MGKKLLLPSVLIVLVPYLAIFVVDTILFSTRHTFFAYIINHIFHNNIWNLIGALLIYYIFTYVTSVLCFIFSICKKWDALSLARTAMILKLAQIPAYLLIFVLGAALFLSIFTLAFSVALFLIDCLSVFMTGLFVISSVILAIKSNIFTRKQVLWVIVLQFVFCADVIASVIFYRKLKKGALNDHTEGYCDTIE